MVSKTRVLTAVLGLLALSFAIHYVMFGSLPIGQPAMLDDE